MNTTVTSMQEDVKYWYIPAIIGLILIIVGIYLFTVPAETYVVLIGLFIASFIIGGLLEIVLAIANASTLSGWGWYLVGGILMFLTGLVLAAQPEVSAATLPLFAGFALLFKSLETLGFAFDLKGRGYKWGALAVASVLGGLFAVFLLSYPGITAISLSIITALAFVFTGLSGIVLSSNLKGVKNEAKKITGKNYKTNWAS